jgi:hypothetical protein
VDDDTALAGMTGGGTVSDDVLKEEVLTRRIDQISHGSRSRQALRLQHHQENLRRA